MKLQVVGSLYLTGSSPQSLTIDIHMHPKKCTILLLEKGGDWKRKSKSGSLPIDVALSLTSQKKVRCAEVLRQWNEHNGRPQKKKQAKPEDSRWGYHYIPPTDHTGRTSRDRTSGWDDEWEKEKLKQQEKKKSKSKK